MGKPTNNFWWKLHSWTGLYAGIVIGVVCLTGGVAVFIPEIDRLLRPDLYRVTVRPSQPGQLNVAIAQARRQYPGYELLGIDLPDAPGEALRLDLFKKVKKQTDSDRQRVFINPHTGEVIGTRDEMNSLANYLRQIHVRLYDGLYGRQIVGLAGIALFLSALSGLVIYGNFMKRKGFTEVRRGRGLRIWMADWHKLVGISALAFNLMIAGTGAWLGLQPKLMSWFSMNVPNAYKTEKRLSSDADRLVPFDLEKTLAATRRHFPDLRPAVLRPSSEGQGVIEIYGDVPTGVYERHINKLVLDKTDYRPLFKYDVRGQNGWHKLYFVQEGLHFGQFGGMTLKWLYLALGLTASFLSVSGFVIYLQRKAPKGLARPEAESAVKKKVFAYGMASLGVLFLIGFCSLTLGYVPTAQVVTASVYVGLAAWLIWEVARYVRRRRKPKKQPAYV